MHLNPKRNPYQPSSVIILEAKRAEEWRSPKAVTPHALDGRLTEFFDRLGLASSASRWKSGRRLPQSKTLARLRWRLEMAELLDCGSPLPLFPAQTRIYVCISRSGAIPRKKRLAEEIRRAPDLNPPRRRTPNGLDFEVDSMPNSEYSPEQMEKRLCAITTSTLSMQSALNFQQ